MLSQRLGLMSTILQAINSLYVCMVKKHNLYFVHARRIFIVAIIKIRGVSTKYKLYYTSY